MQKVKIVSDSTADLPEELYRLFGIEMVPLTVHFGNETYQDHVELKPQQFFDKLSGSAVLPRTSQPSPAEFVAVYTRLFKQGFSVVSIHLSSKLSGTYQSACMAKAMLPEMDIAVIDSKKASMALGLVVLEAGKAAAEGASKEEIVSIVNSTLSNTHVYFAVDTLEYLHKNGRIGKAQHLIGSLLNVKPILTLDEEGYVSPIDKVRGRGKVIPCLIEQARKHISPGSKINLSVVHGNVPDLAAKMADELKKVYEVNSLIIACLGSVIGTHAGPGTLATCYFKVG